MFDWQTCQVLHPTTIPIRGCLLQVWGVIILHGLEVSTQILSHPLMASMAIHPMCVIVIIQYKRIPVWCPTYRTLICLLV